jgi:hypothetical protein
MIMLERKTKKKFKTIPIVPQMFIAPPEMFLTWECCLGRMWNGIREG